MESLRKSVGSNRRSMLAKSVFAAVLATAVSAPMISHAQEAIEEIVVTAQKRDQTLQEVPLAVSVLQLSLIHI